MKTIINTIPGYRVFEYQLVLNPHEELRNKIIDVKTAFYDKYKAESARWGKPYITLASYFQYQMMEERIVSRLQQVAMGFPPIKVELKDYGSFPSHTIYINITSKLEPWQYEKAWPEYSHKHFTGRFIADGMLLLKRQAGEMKYQVVQRFVFQNLPVTIRQGDLFDL